LKKLRELGALTAMLGPLEQLQSDVYEAVRQWVVGQSIGAFSPGAFEDAVERGKKSIRTLLPGLLDLLREILSLRQALLVHPQPYPGLQEDIAMLVPPDFLRRTPYEQLAHFPRYLRGMKFRADRWRQNPAKDAERWKQLTPYVAAIVKAGEKGRTAQSSARNPPGSLRWLVEEFRVSLFAQELGTAEPVSSVKLDRVLASEARGEAPRLSAPPSSAPKPLVIASQPAEKKTAPLKNLGALDKLFPR
jgi:ATP-dependent helicase HrpA